LACRTKGQARKAFLGTIGVVLRETSRARAAVALPFRSRSVSVPSAFRLDHQFR